MYVNLKEVVEFLGYEIDKKEEGRITFFTLMNYEVEVIDGLSEIKIDSTVKKLPEKIQLTKGELFVPLREFLTYLGINISIDWKKREIYIYPQIKRIYQNPDMDNFTIEFAADAPLTFETKKLTQPDRIIIDILSAYIGTHPEIMEVNKGIIEKIRCSQYQFTPYPVARYVIDVKKPISYSVDLSDKGNEIYLEFPHQIIEVTFNRTDEMSTVEIVSTGKIKYKHYYLPSPDRIIIDLSETIMSHFPATLETQDKEIPSVRSSQFSSQPLVSRVVIDTSEKFNYEVKEDEKFPQKIFCKVYLYPSYLKGKKIMLDAGHGGRDPGAVSSILGLVEKELNLDIVNNLYSLLHPAGTRVFLTRKEDIFISLNERVQMAIDKEVDIFISVHCNTLPSDILRRGTRAYYYSENSKELAEIMQKNLVEEIQTISEGTKTAGFVVIKKTTMPSVLVEVAYLTNEEDEKLLSSLEFRKSAAQGIYNGIKFYFQRLESRKK